jgi:hypothetical protein
MALINKMEYHDEGWEKKKEGWVSQTFDLAVTRETQQHDYHIHYSSILTNTNNEK